MPTDPVMNSPYKTLANHQAEGQRAQSREPADLQAGPVHAAPHPGDKAFEEATKEDLIRFFAGLQGRVDAHPGLNVWDAVPGGGGGFVVQ